MAERVKLWDPEALATVDSQRTYLTHEMSEMLTDTGSPFRGVPMKHALYLYEDESTGLVTADVAKFERLMSLILKK